MLLEEFITPLGITQTDLASRLGVSYPRLNEIIKGRRSVYCSGKCDRREGGGAVGT